MTVARACSIAALAVTLITAGAGLLYPDVYRDNGFVRAAWMGFDLVTLFIAVPMMIAALIGSWRGSAPALLIWMGVLDYLLYGYSYYLFGAAFNPLFLGYVALVALPAIALVFGLLSTDAVALTHNARPRPSDRWIASYMFFVALGLTSVYVLQSAAFIATGVMPGIVALTGHPTSVVFALDLTLLVPPTMIAAAWLWNHRPWGFVLAALLNVKGAIYTLSLIVSSLMAVRAGYTAAANEVPLWLVLTIGNAICAVVLLARVRNAAAQGTRLD